MRNLSLLSVFLLFVSFGFKNHYTAAKVSWIDKWRVEDTVAQQMIQYLDQCDDDCHDESTTTTLAVADLDRKIVKELQRQGYQNFSASYVNARYTETEAKKYKKNRNFGDERGNVKGYKTVLLVITPKSNETSGVSFAGYRLVSSKYFDVYTICPPPAGCKSSQ